MWLLCTRVNTRENTKTCIHSRRYEYSTQWNALFCIILLYKMLEVHVFFKLCRYCNCNEDKCQTRRRGVFGWGERKLATFSGMINSASGEPRQNRKLSEATRHQSWTVAPLRRDPITDSQQPQLPRHAVFLQAELDDSATDTLIFGCFVFFWFFPPWKREKRCKRSEKGQLLPASEQNVSHLSSRAHR